MIGKQLIVNLWRSFGTYWQICGPMFWRKRRRVISDTWTIIGWIKLGGRKRNAAAFCREKHLKGALMLLLVRGGGHVNIWKCHEFLQDPGVTQTKSFGGFFGGYNQFSSNWPPPPICLNKIFIFRVNFKSIPWMLFNPGWTSGKSFVGTSSFSFSSRNSTWLH